MSSDRPKQGISEPAGSSARHVLQPGAMGLSSVDSVGRAASKTQSRGRTTTAENTTRVMIVEDDRDLREVYAAALEDEHVGDLARAPDCRAGRAEQGEGAR